jgi:hypothetical protein
LPYQLSIKTQVFAAFVKTSGTDMRSKRATAAFNTVFARKRASADRQLSCGSPRNFLYHLGGLSRVGVVGDIGLRHDAAAGSGRIDHQNSPYLRLFHPVAAIFHGHIRRNGDGGFRHRIACGQIERITALGNYPRCDVAVSYHANRFLCVAAVDNRNTAAVALDHHSRHFLQARVRGAALRILSHQIVNCHFCFSLKLIAPHFSFID